MTSRWRTTKQSVPNTVTRLIYRKSRCQHVTPLLRELHWLPSREHVDFKLADFIFRCLHGLAPRYLSDDIRHVESNRRRLRSSSSALLTVRPTRLVTMDDRAFPVAGSRLWNSLPHEVTSAFTLPVFCSRLMYVCTKLKKLNQMYRTVVRWWKNYSEVK